MSQFNEQDIAAGETVYEEGDPGDALYIVADGRVEVLRQIATKQVRLGVLGKGSIFGEFGVIRNKARSTTVRAIESAHLMVIPKETFLSVFNQDNPLALTLLRTLCDRLAQAHMDLLTHRLFSVAAPHEEVGSIRLLADSPEMLSQIGHDGITIDRLPYYVGRHLRPEEKETIGKADLMVQASHGDEISPQHFAIESQDGRMVVRDLASHLGTLVAGRRIGHFEEFSTADLRFGATPVQGGSLDSPYRFQIVVERREA